MGNLSEKKRKERLVSFDHIYSVRRLNVIISPPFKTVGGKLHFDQFSELHECQ